MGKVECKAKHKVFEFIFKKLEFLKERNLYMRYVTFLVGFQKKKKKKIDSSPLSEFISA